MQQRTDSSERASVPSVNGGVLGNFLHIPSPFPWKRALLVLLAIVVSVGFFGYNFALTHQFRLNDPDLWWHLVTGEYIIDNHHIPTEDPFNYTSPKILNKAQIDGLRAAWLGQTIFGAANKTWGLTGVAMVRNVLIVLPMLMVFLWMLINKGRWWMALMAISMPALMLNFQLFYSFERPQGMSFNLAIVTVILIERVRTQARLKKFDFSYPLLMIVMALWSNIHAGFLVGNYIVGIYLISEAAMYGWYRWRKTPEKAIHPRFFLICAGALLATGLNPNGFDMYIRYTRGLLGMFLTDTGRYLSANKGSGSWVRDVVLEYKPLYYFYENLHYTWLMYYWLYTAALFLTMFIRFWLKRTVDLAEFFTVAFVTIFANMYARGLMFSLCVIPMYFARNLMELYQPQKHFRIAFKSMLAIAMMLAIGFTTYSYQSNKGIFQYKSNDEWISPWYPKPMADFIMKNKIEAPMYNYYTWGGFLIYTMYPQYRVFIDGRALDNNSSAEADQILKAFPGWQSKLDVYNINFIAIPVIFRESGHVIPLATQLVDDPNWKLVFILNNAAVFVRDVPKNQALIQQYNYDKRHVFREIVDIENMFIGSMPGNPTFQMAKAQGLIGLGRYAEARQICEQFKRYPEGAACLQSLRSKGM